MQPTQNPASPKYDNIGKNIAPSNMEVAKLRLAYSLHGLWYMPHISVLP